MPTRIFDTDNKAGITRLWHTDPLTGDVTLETQQHAGAILEENKAMYNHDDHSGKKFKGENMHRVASIPLSLYFELSEKGILEDQKKMKAWLNDRDNMYFRTKAGRI